MNSQGIGDRVLNRIFYTALFLLALSDISIAEQVILRNIHSQESIKDFFSETYPFPEDIKISAKWVLDEKRDRESEKRFAMVSESIDLSEDLSFLDLYGLKKVSGNSYRVDIPENPGWITIKMLIVPFYFSGFIEQHGPALENRGLSKKDLQVIEVYLGKNNYKSIQDVTLKNYMKTSGKILAEKYFSDESDKFLVYREYQDGIARILSNQNRAWTKGLFRELDERAQRILLSYLIEQLSHITIMENSNLEANIENLFERMLDDKKVANVSN